MKKPRLGHGFFLAISVFFVILDFVRNYHTGWVICHQDSVRDQCVLVFQN